MTTFRWLHLSDFHLGMNHHAELWPNMEAHFFEDLNALLQGSHPLDLVLFTGDLVQRGDAAEYQQLEEWLQKLWDRFSELKHTPLLLAVPGNHDLVRPPEGASASMTLQHLWNRKEVQDKFWNNRDSEYRKLVDQAFDNYSAWWRNTKLPKPERIIDGLLPSDFSTSIVKDKYSLAVIGLNSAFRHLGDKSTERNLSVDVRQLNAVCGGNPPEWLQQHHICLLMTHHPVSWLSEEARDHFESEIHSPPERFAVHLFGHMHENNLTSVGRGGGLPRRHLQGASLFGLGTFGENSHKRSHGYSLGELTIENAKATICFKPRKAERFSNGSWGFVRDHNFKLDEASGATFPELITLLRNEPAVVSMPQAAQSVIDHSSPPKVTYDPRNPAFLVPFRAKGKFMVGRTQALDKVRQQLLSGKPTSIGQTAVFQGIGGLGKTQLAVEYAYHYQDNYPNGVYWLTADENIDAQLTRIAVEARWIAPESEHAIKLALARHRLKSYSDCLIVFDNLESVEAIRDYLPDPSACPHILVTSRREQLDFADIKLDLLDEDESYQLLVREAGAIPQDPVEESAARDVAVALNGLPLALELAGAYLARRAIGWVSYRDLLRVNLKQALPTRLSSLTKHDADLFKTLSISERDISDEPLLRDVLDLLTWSGSSPMGLELMAHLINDLQPTQLYGALGLGEALRLLQKTPDGERYSIHRLVKEVRRQDHPLEQRRDWVCDIARKMGGWFKDIRHEFSKLPAYEAEIEHLSAWKTQTELFSSLEFTRLLWLQSYPAHHWGRYKEALAIVQKAIRVYEEQKLNDPLLKANLFNDFASISRQANGVTQENITIGEQALAMRRELWGEKHPEVAGSLSNLATYHAWLGNTARALELGEQALAMRRELLGEKHADVALSLGNIANYYFELSNIKRALKLGEQALIMWRELRGEKHPDVAGSLDSLAGFYSELGDNARALELSEQALAMFRELWGEKHPDVARSLGNLAAYYSALGDNNHALQLGEKALAMRRELLGENHLGVANSLHNLAGYYSDLGDNDRALELGEKALAMLRELLGEKHPHVARSMHSLAGYHSTIGNNARALELAEQAFAMRRELLGDNHPLSINSLVFVAKRLCANPFHAKRGKGLVEEFLKHMPHDHQRRGELLRFLNSLHGFRKINEAKVKKKQKKRR